MRLHRTDARHSPHRLGTVEHAFVARPDEPETRAASLFVPLQLREQLVVRRFLAVNGHPSVAGEGREQPRMARGLWLEREGRKPGAIEGRLNGVRSALETASNELTR